MEMSLQYLVDTAEHLQRCGLNVTKNIEVKQRDEVKIFERTTCRFQGTDVLDFSIEHIAYPNGEERFFAQIDASGPLRCTSYPLDSWKFRPDSIELKFDINPRTGMGLAFTIRLKAPDTTKS